MLFRSLLGLRTSPDWKKLRVLGVIVDADDAPHARFEELRVHLAAVGCAVQEPFAVSEGTPKSAIFLLPRKGQPGTLEHLIVEAISASDPQLVQCVDNFAQCLVKPLSWKPNEQAKMRVHAMVAGCCDFASLNWPLSIL